jgi:hypothetical protein
MTEEEFDALFPGFPFRTQDPRGWKRNFAEPPLCFALWGRDNADLERKLLAPPAELLWASL